MHHEAIAYIYAHMHAENIMIIPAASAARFKLSPDRLSGLGCIYARARGRGTSTKTYALTFAIAIAPRPAPLYIYMADSSTLRILKLPPRRFQSCLFFFFFFFFSIFEFHANLIAHGAQIKRVKAPYVHAHRSLQLRCRARFTLAFRILLHTLVDNFNLEWQFAI